MRLARRMNAKLKTVVDNERDTRRKRGERRTKGEVYSLSFDEALKFIEPKLVNFSLIILIVLDYNIT